MKEERRRASIRVEGKELVKKRLEKSKMLVIGVESKSFSEFTIEKSFVEGPFRILTSIEEEEKRSAKSLR